MTVLVAHDPGCWWAREGAAGEVGPDGRIRRTTAAGGHSDAARRFADIYGLHKACGHDRGWIAVKLADGSGDHTVYDTRAAAVAGRWPWEDEYFYCSLQPPSMTVCAAASLLRTRRIMAGIEKPDRDQPGGGLEVVDFLTREDQAAQIRAARTGRGTIALARRK